MTPEEIRDILKDVFCVSHEQTIEEVKLIIEKKKAYIGQLVLDNLHLFDDNARNIIGSLYWKEFRERVESFVELDKMVNL